MLQKNLMWPAAVLVGMAALPAVSAELAVGSRGTESTFFISRSENRNQVHYGVRVGEDCRPVGTSPDLRITYSWRWRTSGMSHGRRL